MRPRIADPLVYLERHPGRFHLCHIKDMDRRGEMADVGAGRIDFRKILRCREAAGLKHFSVEHDNPGDPLASIQPSYQFLRLLELQSASWVIPSGVMRHPERCHASSRAERGLGPGMRVSPDAHSHEPADPSLRSG